jgi:hypothetical protein
MTFVVVRSDTLGNTKEYKHTQLKIAKRQFEAMTKKSETLYVTIVHQTKRVDDVVAYWERP